jgi:succinate dehydrogenase flavin-adding protein (antitoxin of CptAB toxin-antitoxin module)
MLADDAPLDERSLSKLRWRCRRGLLENDLLIARFFERHGHSLTAGQGRGMTELMDLADNDLLDLLLRRRDDVGVPLSEGTRGVLEMLRPPVRAARM